MAAVLRPLGRQLGHQRRAVVSATPRLMSHWAAVPEGPPDAILGLTEAYNKDDHPDKVNLGVGAYRDDKGKPFVLPVIKAAEGRIVSADLNKEYAGITGVPDFGKLTAELIFGEDSDVADLTASTQTISGTGALRVAAAFLERFHSAKEIYVPTPTWGNHIPVFKDSGLEVKHYKYYDAETCGLDFEGMVADLKAIADGSAVCLHACAHNPTGVDPTPEQWAELADLFESKNLFPFFDCAYQGFASGDFDRDAQAIRLFVSKGLRPLVTQSFAKNMGLYGERAGALHITCSTPEETSAVLSQIKILIRPMYSNPPVHGARIVKEVLSSPRLRKEWDEQVKAMAGRINSMRASLVSELEAAGSTKDWSHITSQIGMFCYTGISPEQVARMIEEFHVYMTKDGRISVAGLNSNNVAHVAKALHAVSA